MPTDEEASQSPCSVDASASSAVTVQGTDIRANPVDSEADAVLSTSSQPPVVPEIHAAQQEATALEQQGEVLEEEEEEYDDDEERTTTDDERGDQCENDHTQGMPAQEKEKEDEVVAVVRLDEIPQEILRIVLHALDPTDAASAALTCKLWHSLLGEHGGVAARTLASASASTSTPTSSADATTAAALAAAKWRARAAASLAALAELQPNKTARHAHCLARGLMDDDNAVRAWSSRALHATGSRTPDDVVTLLALAVADWRRAHATRVACVQSLLNLHESGQTAVVETAHLLAPALADESWQLREATLVVIKALGEEAGTSRTAEEFVKLLGHSRPEARCAGLEALSHVRATGYVSRIVGAVSDPDADVSRAAARAVGDMPEEAAPFLQHLVHVLRNERHGDVQRASSARSIASLRHLADEECIAALALALRSESADLRRESCLALAEVLPATAEWNDDAGGSKHDEQQRVSIVLALCQLHLDNDVSTRRAVAEALGSAGGAAPAESSEALATLCNDNDWTVRGAAVDAVSHLVDPGKALHAATKCLSDAHPEVRLSAARMIGRLPNNEAAASYIGQVASLVDDSQANIRRAAIRAVLNLWPCARMLGEDRVSCRWDVLRLAVTRRTSDADEEVRRAAVRASARLCR
ncbi:hypothetical protein RI054_09g47380 [Pseudoscourfieldia marina]